MGIISNFNYAANQKTASEATRLRKLAEKQAAAPQTPNPAPPTTTSVQSQILKQMRYQSAVLAEIRDLLAGQQHTP